MEESNKEKSDVESNVIKDRKDVIDELKEDGATSNNDNPSSLPTSSMEESNKRSLMLNRHRKDREDVTDELKEDDAPSNNDNPSSTYEFNGRIKQREV